MEEEPASIKYELNGGSEALDGAGSASESATSVHNLDDSPTTHSIVQLTIPSEVQSVIQPNQQSVIQSATTNVQPVHLSKSNVILVSAKNNSVIQTAQGSLQQVQVVDTSEDSMSNDDLEEGAPRKRRDILTRRPSYRKILNDLGGTEIADYYRRQQQMLSYKSVIPTSAISLANTADGAGIHTLNINNPGGGSTIVQYQGGDGQFFVPGAPAEDQARKREMRLMKNREAARECRRKKKDYIKCLENRVAVLENQNKALIDELKALKELYCQTKIE